MFTTHRRCRYAPNRRIWANETHIQAVGKARKYSAFCSALTEGSGSLSVTVTVLFVAGGRSVVGQFALTSDREMSLLDEAREHDFRACPGPAITNPGGQTVR